MPTVVVAVPTQERIARRVTANLSGEIRVLVYLRFLLKGGNKKARVRSVIAESPHHGCPRHLQISGFRHSSSRIIVRSSICASYLYFGRFRTMQILFATFSLNFLHHSDKKLHYTDTLIGEAPCSIFSCSSHCVIMKVADAHQK